MLYLPLTCSWIVSRRAQRLYLCCACLHLSLLGVLVGTQMAMLESGVASLVDSPASLLLVKVLMWPGILGAALLLVAMWYFWFSYDPSNWLKKAFWFGILFVGNPLGAVLYYFVVYRRSPILDGRAQTASAHAAELADKLNVPDNGI